MYVYMYIDATKKGTIIFIINVIYFMEYSLSPFSVANNVFQIMLMGPVLYSICWWRVIIIRAISYFSDYRFFINNDIRGTWVQSRYLTVISLIISHHRESDMGCLLWAQSLVWVVLFCPMSEAIEFQWSLCWSGVNFLSEINHHQPTGGEFVHVSYMYRDKYCSSILFRVCRQSILYSRE